MSQLKSTEGLEILNRVREILLENEHLKAANKELVACNVDLSSTISELNLRLAVLQANSETKHNLVPLSDVPGRSSYSETPTTVVYSKKRVNESLPDYVPFHDGPEQRPRELIKVARQAFNTSTTRSAAAFMVVPKSGFAWKEVPSEGSWFKPTQRFMKGGKAAPIQNKKFQKTIELVAYLDGAWCYMGSYKATNWTTLGPDDFLTLPRVTQATVVGQTGGKAVRRLHDFQSMYESGELAVVQIDILRVGFNRDLCQCLLDAAETFSASGQPVYSSWQPQAIGRDNSDESQNDD